MSLTIAPTDFQEQIGNYIKLDGDASTGYTAIYYDKSYFDYNFLNPVTIDPQTILDECGIPIPISSDEYEYYKKREKPIRKGICENGFDTTTITESQKAAIELNYIHPALYVCFINAGLQFYTDYISSSEKRYMINEYEILEQIKQILIDNGFVDQAYIPPIETVIEQNHYNDNISTQNTL